MSGISAHAKLFTLAARNPGVTSGQLLMEDGNFSVVRPVSLETPDTVHVETYLSPEMRHAFVIRRMVTRFSSAA